MVKLGILPQHGSQMMDHLSLGLFGVSLVYNLYYQWIYSDDNYLDKYNKDTS